MPYLKELKIVPISHNISLRTNRELKSFPLWIDHNTPKCNNFYTYACGSWIEQKSPELSDSIQTISKTDEISTENIKTILDLLDGDYKYEYEFEKKAKMFLDSCMQRRDMKTGDNTTQAFFASQIFRPKVWLDLKDDYIRKDFSALQRKMDLKVKSSDWSFQSLLTELHRFDIFFSLDIRYNHEERTQVILLRAPQIRLKLPKYYSDPAIYKLHREYVYTLMHELFGYDINDVEGILDVEKALAKIYGSVANNPDNEYDYTYYLIDTLDKMLNDYMLFAVVDNLVHFMPEDMKDVKRHSIKYTTRYKWDDLEVNYCARAVESYMPGTLSNIYEKNVRSEKEYEEVEYMFDRIKDMLSYSIRTLYSLTAVDKRILVIKLNSMKIEVGASSENQDNDKLERQYEEFDFIVSDMFYQNALLAEDKKLARFHNLVLDNAPSKSINYGGIGSIIAHEILHAFDSLTIYLDVESRNILSANAAKFFVKRNRCLQEQYSTYSYDGLKALNSKIEYVNLKRPLSHSNITADQLFFLAHAQSDCTVSNRELVERRILIHSHTHANFRVIGSLSNSNEFISSYSCDAKDVRSTFNKKCHFW
ncbi:neprilysin-11-like [Gordionus sp. m RMFG-2023]|uniref:neprilysin-11-like n=1 Tax=Gordionus sp. m RMFG-2023 TaxID=3053472 RepID=UPI0031FDD0B9